MNSTIIYCMIIVCSYVGAYDVCIGKTILSDFNQTEEFVVPTCRITQIRLKKEISYFQCRYNYGYQGPVVWVKDGCQGKFLICYETKSTRDSETVTCTGKGYTECWTAFSNLYWIVRIQELSFNACAPENYGIKGNMVWVRNGCQGTFLVYGLKTREC